MRTPKLGILLAAILVGTAFLSMAPTASAQQSGSLTITLNTPSESVKPLQAPLTISGTATLVGDGAAYTGLIGVPVTFTATGPAWASIIVSPSTAVFNVQGTPSQTYTS